LTGALSHLGLLAGVGAVLSLGFLLFIVLSGYLAHPIIGGSDLERVERNVDLAKSVFLWCLWIVVITGLIRHYQTETSGVVVILAGLACWGLLPLVVRSGVSDPATGAAAAEIVAQRAAQRPSPMGRCWELQFCRGGLRSNCPRFLQGASCWKKRSGCYCDQSLVTGLLSGVGARARVELAEELESAQSRTRKLSYSRQSRKKEKRPRPPCGECPIYLEHQTHKYRLVSWLSYPAAAAITGLTLGPIRLGYDWTCDKLGWLGVSIDKTGQGNVYYLPQWLSFENAMVLVIGVVVVGLILQITEVVIFRFKW